MRLPVLNDAAKLQVLGIGLGLASALYTADHMSGVSIVVLLFGAVATFFLWESFIGMKLAASLKSGGVVVGFVTGFAFPWAGLLLALAMRAIQP